MVAPLALAGCSLLLDASRYEHDDAAGFRDAGADGGPGDPGPPACDGTQPCCSWLDCGDGTRPYCAYDEARGSWSCVAACTNDLDCAGYLTGDACLLESGEGFCGCRDDADCSVPGASHCRSGLGDCVECLDDGDCPAGRVCAESTCT